MQATLHEGEMVVPSTPAARIRDSIAGGASASVRPSMGDMFTPSVPQAASSPQPKVINITNNFNGKVTKNNMEKFSSNVAETVENLSLT